MSNHRSSESYITKRPDYLDLMDSVAKMNKAGLPWRSIAWVMHEYHGVERAPDTWRGHLRQFADPGVKRPRGVDNVTNKEHLSVAA